MNVLLILMTRRWSNGFSRSLALCALLVGGEALAADWQKLPSMPEPNGGFIGGVVHGKVVVIGGTNWEGGKKNWLAVGHEFDPQALQWKKSVYEWKPVAYAVAGPAEDGPESARTLLFAGGFTGQGGNTEQRHVLPSDAGTGHGAMMLKPGVPANRATALAAGGVLGGRLIFCGGTDDPANIAGLRRSTFALDQEGKIEELPDFPGKGIGTAGSAIVGQELFVFGGANWTGTEQGVVNTDEAWAFSMGTKSWRKLKAFPYAVRGLTAVAITERHIYIAGGYKNDAEGFTNQAFLYDVVNDSYLPATAIPYTASVGLINCGGFLYCLGGEDKQKSRTDLCFRIRIADLIK